jgi:VanZ family protein
MLSTNWRGYRVVAWGGQFLLALAVVVAVYQGQYQGALTLTCFLIASLAFVALENRLPTLFDFLFVLAALLNAGGWVWGLFYLPGPYDEITHAFTTFSVTLALSFLVYSSLLTSFLRHRTLFVLVIASFGIAIGALWEVTEWLIGVINSVDDTIIDLIMDSIGSTIAALVSLWALQERIRPESTDEDQQASSHSRPSKDSRRL